MLPFSGFSVYFIFHIKKRFARSSYFILACFSSPASANLRVCPSASLLQNISCGTIKLGTHTASLGHSLCSRHPGQPSHARLFFKMLNPPFPLPPTCKLQAPAIAFFSMLNLVMFCSHHRLSVKKCL